MALRIVMHEAFSSEDVEAARRAAQEHDVAAEVSATYITKSVEPVLIILIFVGGPFAHGFLGKAGEDAWDALRKLVARLRSDLRAQSQILIEDDVGLQLVLGPATPAEALASLPDDVGAVAGESSQLTWDDKAGVWTAPF